MVSNNCVLHLSVIHWSCFVDNEMLKNSVDVIYSYAHFFLIFIIHFYGVA